MPESTGSNDMICLFFVWICHVWNNLCGSRWFYPHPDLSLSLQVRYDDPLQMTHQEYFSMVVQQKSLGTPQGYWEALDLNRLRFFELTFTGVNDYLSPSHGWRRETGLVQVESELRLQYHIHNILRCMSAAKMPLIQKRRILWFLKTAIVQKWCDAVICLGKSRSTAWQKGIPYLQPFIICPDETLPKFNIKRPWKVAETQ